MTSKLAELLSQDVLTELRLIALRDEAITSRENESIARETHLIEKSKELDEREKKVDSRERSVQQVRNDLSIARMQYQAANERETKLDKKYRQLLIDYQKSQSELGQYIRVLGEAKNILKKDSQAVGQIYQKEEAINEGK